MRDATTLTLLHRKNDFSAFTKTVRRATPEPITSNATSTKIMSPTLASVSRLACHVLLRSLRTMRSHIETEVNLISTYGIALRKYWLLLPGPW